MRFYLIFLLIFVSTLRAWYFSGLGVSIDNAVLLVAVFLFILYPRYFKSISTESAAILMAVGIAVIWTLWYTIFVSDGSVKILTMLAIVLFSLTGILFSGSINESDIEDEVKTAIKWALLLHSMFLFIQFVAMIGFGVQLDYLYHITGEESRVIGGASDNIGIGFMFRPSGLHNEPGTYSSIILCLLVVYLLFRDYTIDYVAVLSIISVLMTFSSQGVLSVMVVIFVLSIYNFRSRLYVMFLFPVFTAVGYIVLNESIFMRFFNVETLQDNSFSTRLNTLDRAFSSIWGNGFVVPNVAVADSTSVVYWWWYAGFFSLPFLGLLLFYSYKYWRKIALPLFILLTSKVSGSYPIFWLLIGLSISFCQARTSRYCFLDRHTRET
jgi:hypothetical protein